MHDLCNGLHGQILRSPRAQLSSVRFAECTLAAQTRKPLSKRHLAHELHFRGSTTVQQVNTARRPRNALAYLHRAKARPAQIHCRKPRRNKGSSDDCQRGPKSWFGTITGASC